MRIFENRRLPVAVFVIILGVRDDARA